MKKSELKNLIKECINEVRKEILKENKYEASLNNIYKNKKLRNDMRKFLDKAFKIAIKIIVDDNWKANKEEFLKTIEQDIDEKNAYEFFERYVRNSFKGQI